MFAMCYDIKKSDINVSKVNNDRQYIDKLLIKRVQ